MKYSTDGTSWRIYSEKISINQGQTYYLKGNNPTGWSTSYLVYSYFTITGDVSISGSVMGLLDNGTAEGEQGNITNIPCDYCFYDLFRDSTGKKGVSEDFLPATSLIECCYLYMFDGCRSLTTAPNLPAITLLNGCYREMFNGCSALNSIEIGYAGNYNSSYFENWVTGVASSGTFYYIGEDSCKNFGFPSGWIKP